MKVSRICELEIDNHDWAGGAVLALSGGVGIETVHATWIWNHKQIVSV